MQAVPGAVILADLVIFGTGEGASLATRYFSEEGRHRVVGYTVDAEHKSSDRFLDRDVVVFDDVAKRFPPGKTLAFVALGFQKLNTLRAAKFAAVKALGYRCASYVAGAGTMPPETKLGENCFILAHQAIDRDVTIGDNVTMWSACHIGDRSRIGDHCWLSSHVCLNGDVTVEECCFLASNCTISEGVTLGARTLVGANGLITRDTKPGAVHVENPTPAQPIDSLRFMAMLKLP
jgi:sugar O-acyltransferase (sialic acid O-acetyltransferase NeuD family)